MIVIVAVVGMVALVGAVNGEEVKTCWSALKDIPGCLNATIGTIISPACCNVAKELTQDCWLKLFPVFPFTHFLKAFCSGLLSPPPA